MAQKAGNACSVLLHRMASQPAIVLFIKLEVHLLNWVPIRIKGCMASSKQLLQEAALPGMVRDKKGAGAKHLRALGPPWQACSPAKACDFIDRQPPPPCRHLPARNPSIQHGLRRCLLGESGERGPASQTLGRFAGGSHCKVKS